MILARNISPKNIMKVTLEFFLGPDVCSVGPGEGPLIYRVSLKKSSARSGAAGDCHPELVEGRPDFKEPVSQTKTADPVATGCRRFAGSTPQTARPAARSLFLGRSQELVEVEVEREICRVGHEMDRTR